MGSNGKTIPVLPRETVRAIIAAVDQADDRGLVCLHRVGEEGGSAPGVRRVSTARYLLYLLSQALCEQIEREGGAPLRELQKMTRLGRADMPREVDTQGFIYRTLVDPYPGEREDICRILAIVPERSATARSIDDFRGVVRASRINHAKRVRLRKTQSAPDPKPCAPVNSRTLLQRGLNELKGEMAWFEEAFSVSYSPRIKELLDLNTSVIWFSPPKAEVPNALYALLCAIEGRLDTEIQNQQVSVEDFQRAVELMEKVGTLYFRAERFFRESCRKDWVALSGDRCDPGLSAEFIPPTR